MEDPYYVVAESVSAAEFKFKAMMEGVEVSEITSITLMCSSNRFLA